MRRAIDDRDADVVGILSQRGVDFESDFHELRSTQVEALIEEADRVRYRRPANANGSRARYFYARLQRLVRRAR